MDVHEWVLQTFSKDEQARLPEFLDLCFDGVETWVKEGIGKASTNFNSKTIAAKT
jgi:peptidyl-tRNA hydrolase